MDSISVSCQAAQAMTLRGPMARSCFGLLDTSLRRSTCVGTLVCLLAAATASAQAPATPAPAPPSAPPGDGVPSIVPPAQADPAPPAQPAPPPNANNPAYPQGSAYAPPPSYPPPVPQQGYPSAAQPYYAPGDAPGYPAGYGPPQQGYGYGYESAPPGYGHPTYQAVQGRMPGPGSHEHEGFYLHLGTGVGAGGASYRERVDTTVADVTTRGIAVTFDLGLGGRVVENFMLHGNLTLTFFGAKKRVDGVEDYGYDSIQSTLWLIGGGGTYYIMPTNLYLTAVIGTAGLVETRDYASFGYDEEQVESTPGFGGALSIGKEWWVGGRGEWGIGAAIKGMVCGAPIEIANVHSTMIGHSVTLQFSATYN